MLYLPGVVCGGLMVLLRLLLLCLLLLLLLLRLRRLLRLLLLLLLLLLLAVGFTRVHPYLFRKRCVHQLPPVYHNHLLHTLAAGNGLL